MSDLGLALAPGFVARRCRTVARRYAAKRAANERLQSARENFLFAIDTLDGFPSDETGRFAVDAHDELLNAEAVAQEFLIPTGGNQ